MGISQFIEKYFFIVLFVLWALSIVLWLAITIWQIWVKGMSWEEATSRSSEELNSDTQSSASDDPCNGCMQGGAGCVWEQHGQIYVCPHRKTAEPDEYSRDA